MTDCQRMHDGIMNWIRISNRKPTVDDADESGAVWVYDRVSATVSSALFIRQTRRTTHTGCRRKNAQRRHRQSNGRIEMTEYYHTLLEKGGRLLKDGGGSSGNRLPNSVAQEKRSPDAA